MRRVLREQSLTIFFLALMLLAVIGQAVAGHAEYNNEQVDHARLLHEQPQTISFGRYLTSSVFGNAVMENWQSEYLQFSLYIFATIWLLQRGSTESKELDKQGRESEEEQKLREHATKKSPLWARIGGVRTFLYSNSLLIVMTLIFVGSWAAQSFTGWSEYNEQQVDHRDATVSWTGYLGTADFWESTLQNWQSEFLAVGSMAVLSIYLRQRGSPESKPVGAAHDDTGVEG